MPRRHKNRVGKSPFQCMREKIEEKRVTEFFEKTLTALARVGLINVVGERDGEALYQMNQFGRDLRAVLSSQQQFDAYCNLVMSAIDNGIDDPALAWSLVIENATRDEIAQAMQMPFEGDDDTMPPG